MIAVWLATQNHSTLVTETTVVPFLPVNPEYSSTRNQVSQQPFSHMLFNLLMPLPLPAKSLSNFYFCGWIWLQGRQKLARFNAHEFATLVIDILTDAKRRQQGNCPDNVKGKVLPELLHLFINLLSPSLTLLFLFFTDNVELILKDIGSRHGSESQELDQPDYDSVASDEDTEREPASGKDERTKVHLE